MDWVCLADFSMQPRFAESQSWENFGMRPTDRQTFKDSRVAKAPWVPPTVTSIRLSKDQVDVIVTADDPKSKLRQTYLAITRRP